MIFISIQNRHIKIKYKKERRKQIDIFAESSILQKQFKKMPF